MSERECEREDDCLEHSIYTFSSNTLSIYAKQAITLPTYQIVQCGCPPMRRRLPGHECLDGAKDTPLHFAAMSGRLKIIDYLLECGSDKTIMNSVHFCALCFGLGSGLVQMSICRCLPRPLAIFKPICRCLPRPLAIFKPSTPSPQSGRTALDLTIEYSKRQAELLFYGPKPPPDIDTRVHRLTLTPTIALPRCRTAHRPLPPRGG